MRGKKNRYYNKVNGCNGCATRVRKMASDGLTQKLLARKTDGTPSWEFPGRRGDKESPKKESQYVQYDT
jgi:hypothetical protein